MVWIRLDHIGDLVMSLPGLQLLRDQFPNAKIDVVVRPACAPLLEDLGFIDRVSTYDSPRFPQRDSQGRGRGAGIFRTLQFIRKLRHRKYDVAIEPRGDDIARFLAWGSRAACRIGPDRIFYEEADAPNFRFLMTHVVDNSDAPMHAVFANIRVLQPLFEDRVLEVPNFHFPVDDSQRQRVQDILQSRRIGKRFVVLHPCSNDEKRNWTTENWAKIADFLVEKFDFDIVLNGIARDCDMHREIVAQAEKRSRVHDLAGAIALTDLAAFFSLSQLLVTVDTGPMHIAAFSNVPIVALFLPHLAPRHAPFRQEDSVVTPPQKNGFEYSIVDISVDTAMDAINRKLETK